MSESVEELLRKLPEWEEDIPNEEGIKGFNRFILEYYLENEDISEEELHEGKQASGLAAYREACGDYDGAIGNSVSPEENPYMGSHRDV